MDGHNCIVQLDDQVKLGQRELCTGFVSDAREGGHQGVLAADVHGVVGSPEDLTHTVGGVEESWIVNFIQNNQRHVKWSESNLGQRRA